MAKSAESIPLPRAVGETLAQEGMLASLAWRMKRSEQCLDAALSAIPPALRPLVLAGPWDEQGWTLLTRHSAALTKLRHMLPAIEAALRQRGLMPGVIRVKVLPPA